VGGERDPALVAAFPFDEVGARAPWRWRGAAVRLYANLLGTIPNTLSGTIQKRSA
jgi:homoserine O-succinyltransferase/O-acetyltransferase